MNTNALRACLSSAALIGLTAGCTVSVHAGYGTPPVGQAFVAAVAQPMSALTAAASAAARSCAGGSQPDPANCYANTSTEIRMVARLEQVIHATAAPAEFSKANHMMIQGLAMLAHGLTERNQGLTAHSAAEYQAGTSLINQSLAIQRKALAAYPPGTQISP